MTVSMLDNLDFIALVKTIVKNETEKSEDIKSKREDRRHKFVETNYSTGAQYALSSDRPPTYISDQGANKKSYFDMLEKLVHELLPCNKLMASSKSRPYTSIQEKTLDVPGRKIIEPVIDRLTAAINNKKYRLLKKTSLYDDDVAHDL